MTASILFCKRHNEYESGSLQDRINDAREAVAHPGKFEHERAIAPILYALAHEGGADEETGSVDAFGWAARLGRFVIYEDSLGFAYSRRFPTVELAHGEIEWIASLDAERAEAAE